MFDRYIPNKLNIDTAGQYRYLCPYCRQKKSKYLGLKVDKQFTSLLLFECHPCGEKFSFRISKNKLKDAIYEYSYKKSKNKTKPEYLSLWYKSIAQKRYENIKTEKRVMALLLECSFTKLLLRSILRKVYNKK